ncbi:MAG: twitching motility protein PilT, partial [Proteobacteria bacterium]|nr:twitching motility protein PilT [Pseudomonadota bacterium]
LCLECNAPLRAVAKPEIEHRLPEGVRERQQRFSTCDLCQRIFWEGSHWQRMRRLVDTLLAQPD